MTDLNQIKDSLNLEEADVKKLPGTLNVLTILTFIGCGIGLIFTFLMSWFMNFSAKMIEQAEEMAGSLSDKQLADIEKAKAGMVAFNNNKTVLMIVGIVCLGLCFYGALQMRKLKKTGFYIYTVGELLPIIVNVILLGFGIAFNGVGPMIFGLGIPLVFVILYAMQLKHLK